LRSGWSSIATAFLVIASAAAADESLSSGTAKREVKRWLAIQEKQLGKVAGASLIGYRTKG